MSKGRLTVIQGPAKGLKYSLGKGESAVVGRDPESKFQVKAVGISRKHFSVYWRDENVYIKDLASTNGTYVNKKRIIESTQLNSGDLISIGFYTQLVFTIFE